MKNDIQYLLNKYKINFNKIEIIKEYKPNWANLHYAQYFSTFFLDKNRNVIFSSKIPAHKDTDVLPLLIFYYEDREIEEKIDIDLFLEWKQKIKSEYFKHTDLSFLEFKREMEKQIFKKGDRVFVANYGWGKITNERDTTYTISFDNKNVGTRIPRNLVSFTEYTLEGFSQERPINYEDYIGKWGKFYDEEDEEFSSFTIDKLLKYNKEKCHFVLRDGDMYVYSNYFKPLTEEQIKILGLE